jgi:hypothetical protein
MSRAIIVAVIYPATMAVVESFSFSILEEKDLILAAIFAAFCRAFASDCFHGAVICSREQTDLQK